jgi:hypothetical protein
MSGSHASDPGVFAGAQIVAARMQPRIIGVINLAWGESGGHFLAVCPFLILCWTGFWLHLSFLFRANYDIVGLCFGFLDNTLFERCTVLAID